MLTSVLLSWKGVIRIFCFRNNNVLFQKKSIYPIPLQRNNFFRLTLPATQKFQFSFNKLHFPFNILAFEIPSTPSTHQNFH